MALVTVQQVKAVTGVDVELEDVDQAQGIIDVIGDVDLDTPESVAKIIPRDLQLIRKAVAYQAAWLSSQIAFTERTDVLEIAGSTSTGGVKLLDELSLVLAPLARQCLSRVSWKRRKTMPDPTRASRRALRYFAPAGVVVSHSAMDNPYQQDDFLRDGGLWSEVDL